MLLNSRPLNSSSLNAAGGASPPVEPGEVYTPAPLVVRVRFGQPQAQSDLQLSPISLVSRAAWGQAVVQAFLDVQELQLPSLKGGRIGRPAASVGLLATALKTYVRWGGGRVQSVLTPPSLMADARLGMAQVSATQNARPLVSRLSWGLPVISSVVSAKSLRGGRIGRASLSSITVIEVDYSFVRLRWGEASAAITGIALPLSERARLGRPTIQWVNQCHC